jgi:hypothetical protein
MIFTTQLELNITIRDINAIYSAEYDQMLLDHAKLMYEGKCRDGQYVKSIDQLVKRSLPNLIRRDLDAKIRIYVIVQATIIRYDQYDFIPDMKIHKIIPSGKIGNFDMIECRNDHVVALMKVKKDIDLFKVGDIIPIRVGQSMYKISNSHILVNGYPFVPYIPEKIHYAIGELTSEDKKYYNDMIISLINREVAKKESLDQERWEKFSTLLHSYKQVNKLSTLGVFDIENIQQGIFSIDYMSNLSDLCLSTVDPKPSEIVVSEDTKTALTKIGFVFVKWLSTINELTERYSTNDEFDKVEHVWKLYESHKI